MQQNDKNGLDFRRSRGEGCAPLADYIVLAEFDIDTGSTVRHQYPSTIPGYKMDWFAEYMLPEGAHNREIDYTYIFLNRNSPQIDQDYWIKPNSSTNSISSENTLQSSTNSNKPLQQPGSFLYGINLTITKHDSTVRRGAIVKAMSIFSRYHYIEVFKKPLELALEKYFLHPTINTLKEFFNAINSIPMSMLPRPSLIEQYLLRRGESYNSFSGNFMDTNPKKWYRQLIYEFESQKVTLNFPIYKTPDEVGDLNTTQLIKTFGESVMRIYHGILTKQRVLFVGYNHAASDVGRMVLSAVSLVSPPMINVIKRVFPYSTLSDLEFLEVKGYIAGVTNPMFQQHEKWWDILCILDLPNGTGHVYCSEDRATESSTGGVVPSGNSGISNSPSGNTGIPNSTSGNSGIPSSGRNTPPVVGTSNKGNMAKNASKVNLSAYEESLHFSVDNRFIQGVLSGINALAGENWVRKQFFDYTNKIIYQAQDIRAGMSVRRLSFRTKRVHDANSNRAMILANSDELKAMPLHPWVWTNSNNDSPVSKDKKDSFISLKQEKELSEEATLGEIEVEVKVEGEKNEENPEQSREVVGATFQISEEPELVDSHVSGILMKTYLRKLQHETNLNPISESETFFEFLDSNINDEISLQGMLTLLPEVNGGLIIIASGLLHINPSVRLHALSLLEKVQKYPSTKYTFTALGGFFHSVYERQVGRRDNGELQNDIEDYRKENSVKYSNMKIKLNIGEVENESDKAEEEDTLSNIINSTFGILQNDDYNQAFSATIDELDLIP